MTAESQLPRDWKRRWETRSEEWKMGQHLHTKNVRESRTMTGGMNLQNVVDECFFSCVEQFQTEGLKFFTVLEKFCERQNLEPVAMEPRWYIEWYVISLLSNYLPFWYLISRKIRIRYGVPNLK